MTNVLNNPFDQYRTEWSNDAAVAELFAKPQFFSRMTRDSALIIRGGRGTGKTTVLKYLSFDVQSLQYKSTVGEDSLRGFLREPRKIGVYYRLNTASFSLFKGYGLDEDRWRLIFGHYFNIILVQKIWDIFLRLSDQAALTLEPEILNQAADTLLASLHLQSAGSADRVVAVLRDQQTLVESFVVQLAFSDPSIPFKLTMPGNPVFEICQYLIDAISSLKKCSFHIMLDEFENLLGYQQEVVNTLLKHTHHPVFFKVAGRHYGFRTYKTINGNERVEDGQDYAVIDIDGALLKRPKSYLKLLKEISTKRLEASAYFRSHQLTDLGAIFDVLTAEDEARLICRGKDLTQRAKIRAILAEVHAEPEWASRLFVDDNPLLERYHYALLSRGRPPEEIYQAHLDVREGRPSESARKYLQAYRRVQSNLVFQVLRDERGSKKRYSGFEVLGQLSGGVVRNFIDVCYRAFQFTLDEFDPELDARFRVSVEHQTEAVHNLSESLYNRIASDIEQKGPQVQQLMRRLGNFFKLINLEDEAVSLPSRSYFSTFKESLDPDILELLLLAVMHSFLFERIGWKGNRVGQPRPHNFVFNRMLTPFFEMPFYVLDRTLLNAQDLKDIRHGGEKSIAAKFIKKPSRRIGPKKQSGAGGEQRLKEQRAKDKPTQLTFDDFFEPGDGDMS